MDEENRDVMLHFRVSQSELERIRKKMEEQGIHSMSAYLRKMALDGYCVQLDYQYPKQITTLLRRCSNNLNQYAKRANEQGSIYAADIQDLQERLEEIWEQQKESLQILSKIL
ncbi:MAG: MobC family plasmid mobilization relaxosome protein [Lachnospiraceae bacterium]|nr:MobC family plasmid mobilization relaxosome protein [Lachnospiraceae bacterium]